jgi:hypothetical protein
MKLWMHDTAALKTTSLGSAIRCIRSSNRIADWSLAVA